MSYASDFKIDNTMFSSRIEGNVLVINQKKQFIKMVDEIDQVFVFHEFLAQSIRSKLFDTMLLFNGSEDDAHGESADFLRKAAEPGRDNKLLNRLTSVVNELVIALAEMKHTTVYAGSGNISFFNLNISLAFDYRIVTTGTLFTNTNMKHGVISKACGYFMPRLIGFDQAFEVLLRERITAEEAFDLGLVDSVIPVADLEREAMELTNECRRGRLGTLLGLRKIFKGNTVELRRVLQLEDAIIARQLSLLGKCGG